MRRLFRFRLRTLLVATLLFAGWLGWAANGSREQAETVRLIRSAGGEVFYDFALPEFGDTTPNSSRWAPEWLVQSLGRDFFCDVISVFFGDPNSTRTPPPERVLALERMAKLRGLKELVSVHGILDAPCAEAVCRLTQLDYLYVGRISGADLDKIRRSLPPTVGIQQVHD